MNWKDVEQFLYVVVTYYWWLIALGCAILIMMPMAVKIIKEQLEIMKEE